MRRLVVLILVLALASPTWSEPMPIPSQQLGDGVDYRIEVPCPSDIDPETGVVYSVGRSHPCYGYVSKAPRNQIRVPVQLDPPSPIEKIADDVAKDMVWIGVASGADLFSTSVALRRCPACYEGNKLTPDVESRVALKAMTFPATMGVCYLMRRHGMKKEAAAVRFGVVATLAVAVVINSVHAIRRK